MAYSCLRVTLSNMDELQRAGGAVVSRMLFVIKRL
jgi:hypothetical protein